MNTRQIRVNEFQVRLADWMQQTEPGTDLGLALKQADDALDLVFELVGED